MASLVSSWCSNVQSLPENYVVPVEKRPGKGVPIGKDIPVIDLGLATSQNRADTVMKIMKAGQEFGLFQVVNHGVPENLMLDAMNVEKEFFNMSAEEKAKFCGDGAQKDAGFTQVLVTIAPRISTTGRTLWNTPVNIWRTTSKLGLRSLKITEIIGPYTVEVRKLGMRILDLIYEGLGYGEKDFDKYESTLIINHYPACPDPSSALGSGRHCDANLITIVQQDVYGLQLFKDGKWSGVEPLSSAFVINISLMLEVISNGNLRSAVHQVVTNSACSRTSIATFVNCAFAGTIEPAKSVVNKSNPPLYRAFQFKDFLDVLFKKNCDYEAALEHFKTHDLA